jgi:tRNA pseudouridine38-40 synthase
VNNDQNQEKDLLMSRYFIEVSYKGTNFSGFQIQDNAVTIQSEIEKAFLLILKEKIELTGSSRTDAGVHALQNYFHFDFDGAISQKHIYNMNALIHEDIVIKRIFQVADDAHSRFDAIAREYMYYIYNTKNPFLKDQAYHFPYKLDIELLNEAASIIQSTSNFTSFSKRNTQVKTFECKISLSEWTFNDGCLIYNVKGNRFLRGMVKGLVSTMLLVGREKITIDGFKAIIDAKDCTMASFAVPSKGLFLISVQYPG